MGDLPMKKENETIYGEVVEEPSIGYQDAVNVLQEGRNITNAFRQVTSELNYGIQQFNHSIQSMENSNQRYINAENTKQWIYNNEVKKYNELIQKQNNLLVRINSFETKFWRYKDKLYYRTNSGKLIINDRIEIQKELSSRYGQDVYIVYDMNDVLKDNSQIRINTVYIAINCLPVVDEEILDAINTFEILIYPNGICKRNLLANTRYMKKRLLHNNQSITYIKKLMSNITERKSDCIFSWIKSIGTDNDTILLLVGNQKISEDLIVDKVIKRLFDTGLVVTLTDEILKKQSFEEIISGKLFLHINYIPKDEQDQKKLQELLISIVIHKSILSNGNTLPIQTKVIVTIDEVDPFFKDMMEITKTLFIDTKENVLLKLGLSDMVPLYKQIEESLNYYSFEIASMKDNPLDLYKNENQRYLKSLSKMDIDTSFTSENQIPILNPFNDSFDTLIHRHNRIHTLTVGETGSGKTEANKGMIYSDIRRGDGSVVVIDPHGDSAHDLLRPPIDKERIVFIDPALKDGMTPTYNIFESDKKISEQEIKLQANIIIPVIKAVNDEEKFSSAMKEMLYHCTCVLLRKGDSSFKELLQFMNPNKNKKLIELGLQSPNDLDREYFEDDFPSAKQTRDALRRRLKNLLSDHYFSNLVNGTSTFDLEKLMNTKGKVIIINVNKYNLPEHYGYFTRFILEMIQKFAFNRAKISKADRIPTYCYIDECQNFLTPKIEELITEARKFKIHLNFSFPSIMKVKLPMRNIIASNTNIKLLGKDSNGVADILKKVLSDEVINEIINSPTGQFYLKANNQEGLFIQNSDQLLDGKADISDLELKELKDYIAKGYRPVEDVKVTQVTKDELMEKIQQFKNDVKLVLSSQKSIELSCLNNVGNTAPERLEEIKSDIKYFDTNNDIVRARIRQQELSTVFQLSYGLTECMSNRKFIALLKSEDADNIFNQTDSGTRSGEFTDNGKTKTEEYYYLEW